MVRGSRYHPVGPVLDRQRHTDCGYAATRAGPSNSYALVSATDTAAGFYGCAVLDDSDTACAYTATATDDDRRSSTLVAVLRILSPYRAADLYPALYLPFYWLLVPRIAVAALRLLPRRHLTGTTTLVLFLPVDALPCSWIPPCGFLWIFCGQHALVPTRTV